MGANDYEELKDMKIKCAYCSTIFQINESDKEQPKIIINKSANVIFGEKSNVIIKGGVKINEGANVKFLGKLEILEKGDEEIIKNSKFKK